MAEVPVAETTAATSAPTITTNTTALVLDNNNIHDNVLQNATEPFTSYIAKNFKRFQVALTGGTVTAVGLVLIPAPVPLGCVVAAYGMSILATEFDGAQEALEGAKKKLEDSLESLGKTLKLDDDDDDDDLEDLPALTDTEKAVTTEKGEEEKEKYVATLDSTEETENTEDIVEEVAETPHEKDQENRTNDDAAQNNNHSNDNDNDENEGNEDEEAKKANEPTEFQDILTDKNQSLLDGVGKVWKMHTDNVRKVTSRFLLNNLVPTLRNVNVRKQRDSSESMSNDPTTIIATTAETSEQDSSPSTSMDAPESTASIVSISSTDSSSSEDDPMIITGSTMGNKEASDNNPEDPTLDYAEFLLKSNTTNTPSVVEEPESNNNVAIHDTAAAQANTDNQ